MYIPSSFKVTDTAQLHAFMRTHSFAALVTNGGAGLVATHLPILLDTDGLRLLGHMAKANPQWRDVQGESLVIFPGPHAYVSASWYETPGTVPTWNYATVHAYGQFRLIQDCEKLHDILKRTVSVYEGNKTQPWRYDDSDPGVVRRVHEIVGFEIEIGRLEGKWKLNQNHPDELRRKVINALQAKPDANSQAIATMMVDFTERKNST
jgi:transcriptional regulator